MIIAVCGTPGSYKSCYAVENFVIPALRKGRKVYTNIEGLEPRYVATLFDIDPLDVEHNLVVLGRVYDDDGNFTEDKNLIRKFYEGLPQNALVVIDEAQNYFSSRDFKEGYSADLIPWLTKSRHVGNDVVWITQNLESVDITFRRNTHLTYFLRRTEHMGIKNMSFNYIYDRADTSVRHLMRKTYRPDVRTFACYSSYDNKDVKEQRKSYNVFLRSPFVWLMIIVFCWLGYTLIAGNFQRDVLQVKPKKETKKQDVPLATASHEESVPAQQVEVKNENPERCIVNVSKVHGIAYYNLSDGSSVDSPRGLGYCP